MDDCNQHQHNQSNFYFCPSFLFFSFFLQLDLLAAATTSKFVMVHASSPSRHRLAGEGAPHQSLVAPLTVVGHDKTGQSGLPNRPSSLPRFRAGVSGSCSFRVRTTFPMLILWVVGLIERHFWCISFSWIFSYLLVYSQAIFYCTIHNRG
jgi:hypothetical protein